MGRYRSCCRDDRSCGVGDDPRHRRQRAAIDVGENLRLRVKRRSSTIPSHSAPRGSRRTRSKDCRRSCLLPACNSATKPAASSRSASVAYERHGKGPMPGKRNDCCGDQRGLRSGRSIAPPRLAELVWKIDETLRVADLGSAANQILMRRKAPAALSLKVWSERTYCFARSQNGAICAGSTY